MSSGQRPFGRTAKWALGRRLAHRFGINRRNPLIVDQVDRLKALLDAALRRDAAAVAVLLHAIGYELGHLGYYTTCTFLAERILRAEGIRTPLSGGPPLRRRLVVSDAGGPLEPARPAAPETVHAAIAKQFVTAYGNGDHIGMLTLWARVRDHPDPGYLTGFMAGFLDLATAVIDGHRANRQPATH